MISLKIRRAELLDKRLWREEVINRRSWRNRIKEIQIKLGTGVVKEERKISIIGGTGKISFCLESKTITVPITI